MSLFIKRAEILKTLRELFYHCASFLLSLKTSPFTYSIRLGKIIKSSINTLFISIIIEYNYILFNKATYV